MNKALGNQEPFTGDFYFVIWVHSWCILPVQGRASFQKILRWRSKFNTRLTFGVGEKMLMLGSDLPVYRLRWLRALHGFAPRQKSSWRAL